LHPGPSDGAVGPLSVICFFHQILSLCGDAVAPLRPQAAPRRRFPVGMPAHRCPHYPGLRTMLSARPTFHSEDIQRGRRRANLSFLGPQRPAASHPCDGDAWRVGPRPRPAAGLRTRSGFGVSRKVAKKTGTESVQNGPTRAYLNYENSIFIYTRRRPVADTARGVGLTIFQTSAHSEHLPYPNSDPLTRNPQQIINWIGG
jgi:hypothetical protein